MAGLCFLWVFLSLSGFVLPLDPKYAQKITVYHFHPVSNAIVPINQDTADFRGMIFFDIYSTYAQYLCRIGPVPGVCDNPEIVDPKNQIVLTELVLEVDTRYGTYGKCNICVTGKDPYDNSTKCRIGEYICNCDPFQMHGGLTSLSKKKVPCGAAVGFQDASQFKNVNCTGFPHWLCWNFALGSKVGGVWYSTLDKGYCADAATPNCTWRFVNAVQRINKTCHADMVLTAVEERNKACFEECPARDFHSTCWADCFVKTVVGPDAIVGTPGGLTAEEILEIWHLPLRDPEVGGCPRLPLPHSESQTSGNSKVPDFWDGNPALE